MENAEFKDKLVSINRITKVVKGGRRFSFSAIVVVGDGNGVVGIGLGKSKDVSTAIGKAIDCAKKNEPCLSFFSPIAFDIKDVVPILKPTPIATMIK